MTQEFSSPRFEKNKREAVLREMLPFVREAYAKAQKIMQGQMVDPKNFVHPYGDEVVAKDIVWTEKMLRTQEDSFDINKAHSEIIEAILFEHIEQSDWLGADASTIKTSHFDDIRNGVDLIVEFENENQLTHMGLAVDVTFGEATLQKKFDDIKRNINDNTLSEIKYFESERSPFKGLYKNLPRVVVGVDRVHMFELIRMWMNDEEKKAFALHPVQVLMLQEIINELTHFERYAREKGKNGIATIYHKELLSMQKTMRQKGNMSNKTYQENDGVHNGIKKQLENF